MSRRLTTQEFIKKAIEVHGSKYNYDKVDYTNNHTKIKIYCKECKEYFEQLPKHHLNGQGCKACVKKRRASTTEKFIEKARNIHGDKYNYDHVNYINARTKVKIYCNTCKEYFEQKAGSHLSGYGCDNCANIQRGKRQRSNTQEFVDRALMIHRDLYKYDQVHYTKGKVKIKIYCNSCKEYFLQSPNNHLMGSGCPTCNNSKGEKALADYFADNNIKYEREYTYPDLLSDLGNPLRYDFYLPKCNTLIEFDGIQHREHIKGWMSEYKFNTLQYHDRLKNEYAKKHNITLIRIESIKDIPSQIQNDLKRYKEN